MQGFLWLALIFQIICTVPSLNLYMYLAISIVQSFLSLISIGPLFIECEITYKSTRRGV